MANLKKTLYNITLFVICFIANNAYAITVDGIHYNITSIENLTVEVTGVEDGYLDITIPEYIKYNGKTLNVTGIGDYAFYKSTVKNVKMRNNIQSIGRDAFNSSNIYEIEIPSSVSRLSKGTFENCTNLKKIFFQDGENRLKFWGGSYSSWGTVFVRCPLEEIYLGRTIFYDGHDSYCYWLFSNLNKLKKVTIGAMCSVLPKYILSGAKTLPTIIIPGNVQSIESWAFHECDSLSEIRLEYSSTKLKLTNPFDDYSNLAKFHNFRQKLFIDRELEEDFDFSKLAINNLYIGSNISELCEFDNCKYLTKIEIPANIISLSSFYNTPLKSIICHSSIPPTFKSSYPFSNNVYADAKLIVPKESIDLYKNADIWKYFFEIEGMTAIEDTESETPIDKASDVYDLAGRVVLKKATSDDINDLDKGIYIINGKKICIK